MDTLQEIVEDAIRYGKQHAARPVKVLQNREGHDDEKGDFRPSLPKHLACKSPRYETAYERDDYGRTLYWW